MNIKHIITSIVGLMALGLSAAAADVSFSWPMGAGYTTTAVTDAGDLFSVYEMTVGKGLTPSNDRTTAGVSQSLYIPATNNRAELSDDEALIFTIIPRKGISFKPEQISFKCTRYGTDGGTVVVTVDNGSTTVTVDNNVIPARNNADPAVTDFSKAVTGIGETAGEITVKLYITKLGNTKELGFADIVVSGTATGSVETVPSYTFSARSADEAAGTVTVSPAGSVFDEGTLLTVTATENFSYHFDRWVDDAGKTVSTENPYVFQIAGNTSLTAVYTKADVYSLDLKVAGGGRDHQITVTPDGYYENGLRYYEAGTEVSLKAANNRVLTFTAWEDNTTSPERIVKMDADLAVTANYSAADYIMGWDFYFDEPASQRAADFAAESDNAGLLSLRNPAGGTSSWLSRGITRGQENGKYAARIWKVFSEELYFEITLSTVGYSNIHFSGFAGCSYNTYSTLNAQYSVDGENFKTFGTYTLERGWTAGEFDLPAEAAGQERLYIRLWPDRSSAMVGAAGDYDGLAIAEVFILADSDLVDDNVAPKLVTSIPANGSTGASATGSIILTFDEKIRLAEGVGATLDGKELKGNAAGTGVVYPYAGLDYGSSHTFVLPAGAVTDRSGNPFEGCTLQFTTMERVQPDARLFDVIVAADGSGDYATVQDAIDNAPANRARPWLIFVKNGRYKGHVDIPASKPFIHIIGQDRDKTVITDDRLCGGDNAVHVSVGATVVVNSNDCFFENITLENSYGHEKQAGPQALALNTIGDRTIFNNVAMLSYQDTWITPSTTPYRAYVRNSLIEGAVDFIYNSGDIYIDNTTLLITRRDGGYIVAPSHAIDAAWGYVFNNCTITAPGDPTKTSVWLGRPWHNFPKTVFLNTRAEVTIPATGWYETMGGLPVLWADWNTTDINGNPVDLSMRRDTYYYIDSTTGEKVYGKAKNFLTDEEAAEYTVANVLMGNDNWQPVIKTEACAAPEATVTSAGLVEWEAVPYAICYLLTAGDDVIGFTTDTSMAVDPTAKNLAIRAVNEFGGLSAAAKVHDPAGVGTVNASTGNIVSTVYYDAMGRRHERPVTGVNIVVTIDDAGSVSTAKQVF
ncbi:MAG: Ig-like domain-containing protein [Muribaculaceae bacterium]|nr:Ig-like domain-containing protein [Muribaculaceae bacterium]